MNLVRKIILYFITLSLVISAISLPVKIKADDEIIPQQEQRQQDVQVEILSEQIELCDETSKTFLMSDRSFQKIIYANNIHYQNEDGSYEEIDNSLIDTSEVTTYSNEDDVIGYENNNNPQKLKFSKKAHKSNMVSIKNNDYKLVWGIEGIEHKNEAYIALKDNNDDEIIKVMNQISQSITYPEVFDHVDIEYITTSNGIKENIILKQKQDQNEFIFHFKVKNLELVLNEDGSIHAVNEDHDVIYIMPQPYMYDANGNTSNDVSYELEKNNNKYTLKIIADEQWLNRDDISYPVVIDPYVFTEQKKDNIQISYVSSVYHNTNFDLHKLQIGNKTSHGKCRVLVKVGLDDLNPGDVITGASLNLYQYSHWFESSSAKEPFIAAYRVESNWNETTVTWDTQPNYDKTSVLDYDILTRTTDKWKSFDITSALKRWYDGTYGNYGIMLQLLNEDVSSTNYVYGYYLDDANSQEAGFPFISISYLNNKGLESYYDYTSRQSGSAGSYYVDNYSGNLVVEHSDDSTVGERFPASIIHYYNSYNYNNEFDTTLKVGKGWKLNIFQTIKPSSEYGLGGDSATTFPYVWMDGDGTEIYFKKVTENNTTKYIDETGRGFELTLNNPGYTITDKNDQTMTFNQHGKLIKITDINGNTKTFEYVYGLIKKVWDSAGHYLTLNYDDNGYLIEIVDMSNRKIQYQYNTYHQLTNIVYPDGYSTQYYYDSNGALIQMRNKDTTRINFEYSSLSDGMRITKLYEVSYDGNIGQTMLFSRNEYNTTKLTTSGVDSQINTADDITSVLQYDDAGRITSNYSYTNEKELGGGTGKYSNASSDENGNGIKKLNRLISSASLSKTVNNIIKNHSFETSGTWITSYTGVSCSYVDDEHLYASKSMKISHNLGTSGIYGSYQDVKNYLAKNTTYTLSAYVKVDSITSNNGGAFIRAKINGVTYESEKIDYHTDEEVNEGWRRISISFTTPNTTISEAQMLIGFKNAQGTIYFDGVQLEVGGVANPYNMFENGGMNRLDSSGNIESWLSYGTNSNYDQTASNISKSGTSYKFGANPSVKRIYQNIYLPNESEETTYIASGWIYGKGNRIRENVETSIKVLVYYSDDPDQGVWIEPTYTFNQSLFGWQYGALTFSLHDGTSANKQAIKMSIVYTCYGQANDIYYDNLQLVKQKVYIDDYDEDGNLIKSEGGTYSYDDSNNISSILDKKGETTTYTYDNKHNLLYSKSPYGIRSAFTYDEAGNKLTSQVASEDGSLIIKSAEEYDATKSYKTILYDSDSHKTTYDYDKTKGLLTSIKQYTSANTYNEIKYTYTSSDDLLSSVTSGGITKSYTYDSKDRLSQITHNNFGYYYVYDDFNNLTSSKIGNTTIKTYTYESNNGNLSSVNYANGYSENYKYDEYGQMIEVYNGTNLVVGNVYDTLGNVIVCYDYEANEEYHYDYDQEGKLIRSYICDYTTKNKKYSFEYGYDEADRIEYEILIMNKKMNKKRYFYGKENSINGIHVSDNPIVGYSYDKLLRTTNRSLKIGSSSVDTTYVYKDSDSFAGATTTELLSENIDGLKYTYSYDYIGNITKIIETTDISKNITYSYDANNQLIRENNQKTNQTILYEYDNGGNIKSETIYAYTTGDVLNLTPLKTNSYGYGNSNWKDQLTSYNNQSITYDANGNPTSYLEANLSFHGRELLSYSKNGVTINYSYNADGIRRSKVVGTNTTTYDYAQNTLVHEYRSDYDIDLYYTYDAKGHLVMIETMKNDYVSKFYVAVNSRGDERENL